MTENNTHKNLGLPPEPEKPLRDDCCGGGSCCPCIWDVYYEKLAKWREAKDALEKCDPIPDENQQGPI